MLPFGPITTPSPKQKTLSRKDLRTHTPRLAQPSPASMPRILLVSCTSLGKRVTRPACKVRR